MVVGALTSRRIDTPTRLLLVAAVKGEVFLHVSPALYAEYVDVCTRPKVLGRTEERRAEIMETMTTLATLARWHAPDTTAIFAPDPDDQHLWELLAALPDATLVTGDAALLRSGAFPGRVRTPRDVLAR